MTHCNARQYGDQMYCQTCKLTWDVNDPEPPKCAPPVEQEPRRMIAVEKHETVRNVDKSGVTDQDWTNLKEALETDDWSKFC